MNTEVLTDLRKAIMEYDSELAISSARQLVKEKADPIKALDVMTEAIRKIGDGFARGALWLPDLVAAGDVMLSAMPIVEEEVRRRGGRRPSPGTVVIGTVYGDIHTIGKSMVATLLRAEGFIVHDLGISVKPEEFVEAIKKYDANILAMSALMTITALQQKKTIETIAKEGLRDKIKVMVGGAAVTQSFADSIGADGYDPTAPGAVKLAKSFLGK